MADYISYLPHLNACLNGTSASCYSPATHLSESRNVVAHRACQIAALVVSLLFLASYLTYHYNHGATRFQGTGLVRPIYFTILTSHTILAIVIVPLVDPHFLSRVSPGLRASPPHRADHAAALALRVDHGRDRLSYALPDLSFLKCLASRPILIVAVLFVAATPRAAAYALASSIRGERPVGDAERADLARAPVRVERVDQLADVDGRVVAMEQVEVDRPPRRPMLSRRSLAMSAGVTRTRSPSGCAPLVTSTSRSRTPGRSRSHCPTTRLGAAVLVDVRGVDHRPARLDPGVEHRVVAVARGRREAERPQRQPRQRQLGRVDAQCVHGADR